MTIIFITANWFSFVGFYIKTKDSKRFSIEKLFTEYRRDSIRIIIFITLSILAVCIFIQNEYVAMLVNTLLSSSISIYLNTVLVRKFIHD